MRGMSQGDMLGVWKHYVVDFGTYCYVSNYCLNKPKLK